MLRRIPALIHTVRKRAYRAGADLYRRQAAIREQVVMRLARIPYRNPVFGAGDLARRFERAPRLFPPEVIEGLIGANLEAHGAEKLAKAIDDSLRGLLRARQSKAARTLLRAALRALAQTPELAVRLGDAHVDAVNDPKSTRLLIRAHIDIGNIERPLALLDGIADSSFLAARIARLRQDQTALRSGVSISARATRSRDEGVDKRALYFADQTRPHLTSGYAIRTHYLLSQVAVAGWHVECFARYGYPNDRYDFRGEAMAAELAEVDGLRYHFRPAVEGFGALGVLDYHERATQTLMDQIRQYRPTVVHAASNYQVGLAGLDAARRLGLPSIYEVRGLWHLTRASKQPSYETADHYQMVQSLEVQAAKSADHVFAITGAIRDLLIEEGLEAGRITVLANAVDPSEFGPQTRDTALAKALGLGSDPVIGFIGTFKEYEGIDLLLEAANLLVRENGARFTLLLVGDGPAHGDAKALAERLGLTDQVRFTGRVPHTEVARHYSVIDILAYPRKGVRVCELVSPLKPLEAMCMEKAVVASSVAALAEMIDHGKTGLIHRKDDAHDLASQLQTLLDDGELRLRLARAARAQVLAKRTWSHAADIVTATYEQLRVRSSI